MTDPAPVQLIPSTELADRAPYAYAAVAHDVTRLVYTVGACPLDASGKTVAVGDVTGQAEQVMSNLRTALGAAGADLTDVVKTTVYVPGPTRRGRSCRSAAMRPVLPGRGQGCEGLGAAPARSNIRSST